MKNNARIACITGAAKRIGRHLALNLAKDGWDIAAHYHQSETDIESLRDEVVALGQQCLPIQADLSQEQELSTIIPACCMQLGAPTLLINNASIFEKDDLGSLQGATFDRQMAINLKAPLLLSQSFAQQVIEKTANIINITDQRVDNLNPTFFSYTLSKVGLASATITMAQSLGPKIRVNAIAPGPVLQSIHQTEQEFEQECKTTLLGHGTTVEEIYRTVQFILETTSMTGETITLDGGQHLKK